MTEAKKKIDMVPLLKHMSYIYYSILFKKNQAKIRILLDFSNEINAISLIYITKLSLKVYLTNVKTQKIDDSIFKIF